MTRLIGLFKNVRKILDTTLGLRGMGAGDELGHLEFIS